MRATAMRMAIPSFPMTSSLGSFLTYPTGYVDDVTGTWIFPDGYELRRYDRAGNELRIDVFPSSANFAIRH